MKLLSSEPFVGCALGHGHEDEQREASVGSTALIIQLLGRINEQ